MNLINLLVQLVFIEEVIDFQLFQCFIVPNSYCVSMLMILYLIQDQEAICDFDMIYISL